MKFCKGKKIVGALIYSDSEINIMIPAYSAMLDLKIFSTAVRAQKIDRFLLKIFRIVIASFQIKDKLGRDWFFQETFLLANISMEMILRILFLTLGNEDI